MTIDMHVLDHIKLISKECPENKTVLLRVDFNVSLNANHKIADDLRIKATIPTIHKLLEHNNKIIIISHLGEPEKNLPAGRQGEEKYSLTPIVKDLQKYLPENKVKLIRDFESPEGRKEIEGEEEREITLLENIRFYPEERSGSRVRPGMTREAFAKDLASLGDVYVNDAFGVSHRKDASIVLLPTLLPSYAGLLLEKEITAISKVLDNPKMPVVTIIGGAKIDTKIQFLSKLTEIADFLLLGGGIANTILKDEGKEIGKSLFSSDQKQNVEHLLSLAKKHHTEIDLPKDFTGVQQNKIETYRTNQIPSNFSIKDIGPETEALWGEIISKANTIIWNGPVGYIEEEPFTRGTEFIYYSITQNTHAYSLVGGGDTLAAISKEEYLDKISHISTGGGALLEFIENGTLPGIEALRISNF